MFRTPWFEIESRNYVGQDDPYYVMACPNYVTILPITAEREVLFVKQFRPALDADSLELPSGHIDADETPEQAARRELREETGAEALTLELLSTFRSDTGRMSNRIWTFVADVRRVDPPEAGIEVLPVPVLGLREMIRSGELEHALDVAVIGKAFVLGKLSL
ncbi:MAG TPA: NUDIX hydrolase [Polyangiales bacterium]|nr:NUDIX hydrolase [Polyangiales bacterium]